MAAVVCWKKHGPKRCFTSRSRLQALGLRYLNECAMQVPIPEKSDVELGELPDRILGLGLIPGLSDVVRRMCCASWMGAVFRVRRFGQPGLNPKP